MAIWVTDFYKSAHSTTIITQHKTKSLTHIPPLKNTAKGAGKQDDESLTVGRPRYLNPFSTFVLALPVRDLVASAQRIPCPPATLTASFPVHHLQTPELCTYIIVHSASVRPLIKKL